MLTTIHIDKRRDTELLKRLEKARCKIAERARKARTPEPTSKQAVTIAILDLCEKEGV